jgi:tetratricopeptide (TPR) repeat protein
MMGQKANGLLRRRWLSTCLVAGVLCGGATAVVAAPPDQASREESLSRFAIGIYLLENGQADQAIEPLEDAWRASGHEPDVGARLAEAYYAVRDLGRAEQIVDDVLESDPIREDVLQIKARLCYARRDVSAAIAYLERARTNGPASFETERLLASLYAESGQLDPAIDALQHCINIEPSIAHIHTLRGELLTNADRTEEAETEFRTALGLDPEDLQAMQALVDLMEQQGRLADAIPLLEQFAAQPDAPEAATLKLAEAYGDAGRADDGAHLLEDRRKNGSLSPEGTILLGRLYYEGEHYPEAIGVFGPMYDHAGKSPELARILGELYLRTGNTARAKTYYQSAITDGPKDYRNYLALFFAQASSVTKDGPKVDIPAADAVDLLRKAATLAPGDDFDANYSVGMAFSSVDSLESARVYLARANELKPGDRSTVFNLAAVHEKRHDLDAAATLLAGLAKSHPDDAAVLNFYGYVLAEQGRDLDHAEQLVRAALVKEPENGFFIDSLGWVYYQKGDYKSAAEQLEQAIQKVGPDPVILEHLGDAYAALSRFGDALTAYRQSSKLQDGNPKLREKIESTQRRLQ